MFKHRRISAVRSGKCLLISCPFCHEMHAHGACGPEFGAGNGGRVPHCWKGPASVAAANYSYELREVTPKEYLRRRLRADGFSHAMTTELLEASCRSPVARRRRGGHRTKAVR